MVHGRPAREIELKFPLAREDADAPPAAPPPGAVLEAKLAASQITRAERGFRPLRGI